MTRSPIQLCGFLWILCACSCSSNEQKGQRSTYRSVEHGEKISQYHGLRGAESGLLEEFESHRRLFYGNYRLRIHRLSNDDLEHIDIIALEKKEAHQDSLAIELKVDEHFLALYKNWIFIESGTTDCQSVWTAIDIRNGSRLKSDTYCGEAFIMDSSIHYNRMIPNMELSRSTEDCPDAEEWLEQGFELVMTAHLYMNLYEGQIRSTGERLCRPLEP